MERMNALDHWFLHVEDAADHMHIGSIGVFEGPPPEADLLRRHIGARLERLPRYRQRVVEVPLGMGRPVWVDDPHFSLEYHVRHTALPRPGGDAQLRALVGRVMGQQLDRRRPLWETWFVEGLEGDRWAMVSKVHHCMVDGIAGTDLLALVLDLEPIAASVPAELEPWRPSATPGRTRLVTAALRDLGAEPRRLARTAVGAARHPGRAVRTAVAAAHGAVDLAGLLRPVPATSLTGPIGPHRRWAGARLDLADVKAVRAGLGGTVNDVVLAVVTAGLRDLLDARGELVADTEVRAMVPVSIRSPQQRGEVNNLVAAVFVPLPVAEPDAGERYRALRQLSGAAKGSGEQEAVVALVCLTGLAPAMVVGALLRGVTRLVQRHGQRHVSTVVTNVPGPQVPLYLLGRRMVCAYPFVPIGEGLRIGIAVFSYDGELAVGVTADYDAGEDLDVLLAGVRRGLAELRGLAGLGREGLRDAAAEVTVGTGPRSA